MTETGATPATTTGGRDLRRERLALAVRSGASGPDRAACPGHHGRGRPGHGLGRPRPDRPARRPGRGGRAGRGRQRRPRRRRPGQRPRPGAAARRAAHLRRRPRRTLADRLWYPLWDAGLRLDHSVRTPTQCREVAAHDLSAAIGLLDLRVLAGDAALVVRTRATLLGDWRGGIRRRLPEVLETLADRAERYGEPAHLLEPDLKEARGGLRDVTVLRALAASWVADRPHGAVDEAHLRLLDVRDAPARRHRPGGRPAAAGRAGRGRGRLRADRRRRAAGRGRAGRPDDRATPSTPPCAGPGRRCRPGGCAPARAGPGCARSATAWSSTTARSCSASGSGRRSDPVLPLRAAATAVPDGPAAVAGDRGAPGRGLPAAARAVAGGRPGGAGGDAGRRARALVGVWESLDRAGLVTRLDPGVVRGPEPPAAQRRPPAHRGPAHDRDRGRDPEPMLRDVARPDLLLLAALLHDIGKLRRCARPLRGRRAAGRPGGAPDGLRPTTTPSVVRAAGPRAPDPGRAGHPARPGRRPHRRGPGHRRRRAGRGAGGCCAR